MRLSREDSHSLTTEKQEVNKFSFYLNYYLAQKFITKSVNSLRCSKAFNQQLINLRLFTAKVHSLSKGPFQFLKTKLL